MQSERERAGRQPRQKCGIYGIVAKELLPGGQSRIICHPVAGSGKLRVAAGERVRAPAVSAPVLREVELAEQPTGKHTEQ